MNETNQDASRTQTQRFFGAYAQLAIKYRLVAFVLSASVSAVAAYAALSLRVDNSIAIWLPEDSETAAGLSALERAFGEQHEFQVVVTGDVFSAQYLDRLRSLQRELERVALPPSRSATRDTRAPADDFFGDTPPAAAGPRIERVISLLNVPDPRSRDGALVFSGLLEDAEPEQLPALRSRVLRDPSLVGTLVGSKGQYSILKASASIPEPEDEERLYRTLDELAQKHSAPGFACGLAGLSAFNAAQQMLTLYDVLRLVGATSVATLLMLLFLFRHPLGVVAPLLVIGQSVIWTLGLMSAIGKPLTIVTSMLPAFLLVVGSAEAIHIQTVYRDYRLAGVANREAIARALESTGVPVVFTSVTTLLGLLSLMVAVLANIRDLGLFGSFGIVVALLLSLSLTPAVLSFNETSLLGARAQEAPKSGFFTGLLERFAALCNRLSMPRTALGGVSYAARNRTLLVAMGASALVCWGATALIAEHDQLTWLPGDHQVRRTMEMINDDAGGGSNFAVLLEGKPGVFTQREALLALERFEAYVRAYPGRAADRPLVSGVSSVLDLVRKANATVGATQRAELPATQQGVSDMMTVLDNSAGDELRRFVTLDFSQALVFVRVAWSHAQAYGPLNDYLARGAREILAPYGKASLTGMSKGYFDIVAPILDDLLGSFGTASLVVTMMVMLVLRDLKLGLIAMVPNLLPVGFLLGFMGWSGIPLDVSNMLIASVALGIVVDDTIHLLYQFKRHYEQHGQVEAAMAYAFAHAGTGVAALSLTLGVNFLLFSVAAMNNVKMVGALLAGTVFIAFLGELVLTPAILRLVFRDRESVKARGLVTVAAVEGA